MHPVMHFTIHCLELLQAIELTRLHDYTTGIKCLQLVVIFLHGGPGDETSSSSAAFFNPDIYRVVLLDQRGAGKSKPSAELRNNTSQDLVSDIERLRVHLVIEKWHLVFGGSWGSTLALLYSQTHPERLNCMILRGVFLVTRQELEWGNSGTLGHGAGGVFPEAHEAYLNFLPEHDRSNPNEGYYKLLTSENSELRRSAARASNTWGLTYGSLLFDEEVLKELEDDRWSFAHALLNHHYFKHGAWLEEGQLTQKKNIDLIRHIPSTQVLDKSELC